MIDVHFFSSIPSSFFNSAADTPDSFSKTAADSPHPSAKKYCKTASFLVQIEKFLSWISNIQKNASDPSHTNRKMPPFLPRQIEKSIQCSLLLPRKNHLQGTEALCDVPLHYQVWAWEARGSAWVSFLLLAGAGCGGNDELRKLRTPLEQTLFCCETTRTLMVHSVVRYVPYDSKRIPITFSFLIQVGSREEEKDPGRTHHSDHPFYLSEDLPCSQTIHSSPAILSSSSCGSSNNEATPAPHPIMNTPL